LATTVALPVRSSLYAVYPSAGVAIVAGTIVGALWREATPVMRRRLALAGVLVPLLLVPILRTRNARMVHHAELSARVVSVIRERCADLAAGAVLVLIDDPGTRVNLASTFGTLMDEAVRVTTGLPAGRVRVVEGTASARVPAGERVITYRLRGDQLTREP
jgi:hypothetical protein